jgi:hypothetical protein
MKLTLGKDHRHHFEKEGVIEFDGLLSASQLESINTAIESLPKILSQGRDLWRTIPAIKQLVMRTSLAHIAEELMLRSPIRLAYDQLFIFPKSSEPSAFAEVTSKTDYLAMDAKPITLAEMSCIQGLFGGVMLCLKGPDKLPLQSEKINPTPFSLKAGNGIFLAGDLLLNWPALFAVRSGATYLLITYCEECSVYIHEDRDPCRHSLRDLGFSFGDRLNDRTHPILKR